MTQDMVYRIWLSMACTPGSDTYCKLRDAFASPAEMYRADAEDLKRTVGSASSDYTALCDKSTDAAEAVLAFCEKHHVGMLTYDDEMFPEALRRIPTPPVLLYYRGVVPDFSRYFAIALVGTRRLSAYGRQNAFTVGRDLARAGALVVSGMAIGIDGVALAGAVSTGMPTVAVIGSGIDVCYPSDHRRLAQEIVKNGCVFTEYAPGTPPNKENFPRRNRLISGLCAATAVIEGRERSGVLITARHAKEQGRIVYALPGNVGSKNSEVTNLLIRDGARLFTSADDIVRDFQSQYPAGLDPFRLSEPDHVRPEEVLRALSVSCVTPSDDIFPRQSGNKRTGGKKNHEKRTPEKAESTQQNPVPQAESTVVPPDTEHTLDAEALALCKRIPRDTECPIDSLVDESHPMRTVMRSLLKLEIARMVEMLPGDRVRRF